MIDNSWTYGSKLIDSTLTGQVIFTIFLINRPTGPEMKAHERDVMTPAPILMKPPAPRDTVSMEDVTDFPE
jgi:hypothetical protein